VHPGQGGQLKIINRADRAVVADAFGLVEPDHRLGHSVVVAVADGADRGERTGVGEPVGVLSPEFFPKGWPQYELDGLVTMAVSGRQVLLPLWHGVSKDEVVRQSPSLADKVALRTADYTIAEIASEIASVVRGVPAESSADFD
jgi:hypothetical protein